MARRTDLEFAGGQVDRDMYHGGEVVVPVLAAQVLVRRRQELLDRDAGAFLCLSAASLALLIGERY